VSLSIVIPTHDTRDLVLRAVASVLAQQEGAEAELLVVDDGSADGTAAAVAAAAPAARVLRSATPSGFTAAANRGLAAARGDPLLLLNSDTELEGGALAALAAAFAAEPRLGIAGAQLFYPTGEPQWSAGRAPSLLWLFGLASGLPALLHRWPRRRLRRQPGRGHGTEVDWVSGAALALRRSVWETSGPLDEGFRFYAQDLDFCLRAKSRGFRVRVVPGFGVRHHHGATIGRRSGAVAHAQPELLWTDLLRWAGKARGEACQRRAARALSAGGALRLAGRRLALPFVPAPRREPWRAGTAAFRAARRAVRSLRQDLR
jgi:GT2 family glycosyltransferase